MRGSGNVDALLGGEAAVPGFCGLGLGRPNGDLLRAVVLAINDVNSVVE